MPRLPRPIDPKLRKVLGDDSPEIKALERKRKTQLDKLFPKPRPDDIEQVVTYLKARWDSFHLGVGKTSIGASPNGSDNGTGNDEIAGIVGTRDMRYHRDKLPPKWEKNLEGTTRIRSNLTNTEITNTRSVIGRNLPRVRVPAGGSRDKDVERAQAESRWCNTLPVALERQAGLPLIQIGDDALCESSFMAHEIFLTGSYDDVAFDRMTFDVDGEERAETDSEYEERLEPDLMQAGLPFGIRVIDPLCLFVDWDQYGVCLAVIEERKPYHVVYGDALEKMTDAQRKRANLPHPWSTGVAEAYPDMDGQGTVITRRYYDRRWYCYYVGNQLIECKEHGMPAVPVIPGMGWVTSSPNYAERFQGVTWGMTGLERALNDRLTLDFDVAVTYSRPLPYVETDAGMPLIYDNLNPTQPKVLDLTRGVVQLNPGQHLKDATAGFKVQHTEGLDIILGLFTRSGMNPVAQGETPGTDSSGYAINSLQSGALQRYQAFIDGKRRLWEATIDFLRLCVRDVIREKVYISAPMTDTKTGGIEWLALGPDDITETPCTVIIDPLNDINRAAMAAYLANGVDRGVVPEEELMTRGYGAESTTEWYRRIDTDVLRRAMRARSVSEVMGAIDDAQAAQERVSGLVAADGVTPLRSQQSPAGGGDPNAPTIGPDAAAASRQGQVLERPDAARGTMPSRDIAGMRPPAQGVTDREMARV